MCKSGSVGGNRSERIDLQEKRFLIFPTVK